MKKTLIRLENRYGLGPFIGESQAHLKKGFIEDAGYPHPYSRHLRTIIDLDRDLYFGCTSACSFFNWFFKDENILDILTFYRVVAYTAPVDSITPLEFTIPNYPQAIFSMDKASKTILYNHPNPPLDDF